MKSRKSSVFTKKIDLKLKDKLLADLKQQGFEMTFPEHTIFQAKKKKLTCTFYESGSLVVQGKNMDEFIQFYLEPEILKSFEYTYPEEHTDMTPRIGVDEAGKGDFFGPLCIAGIFADKTLIKKLIELKVKDSKRFSENSITNIAKTLKTFPHVVIRLYPEKYNFLYTQFKNLNQLLGWAHATVIADLQKKTHCQKAIIDQFASKHVVETALKKKQAEIDLVQRHRGEEDIVVAAASILARDSFLQGLDKLSSEISFVLPRGASNIVKEAARKLVDQKGKDILTKVSKTHFKTTAEVTSHLEE